ncbi:hypothetical protein C0992_005417 [Termitomyces sp. T32_za158]|nr:hypothetical protein C0992_005417 [Termitomyces sp. T32_za158]
MSRRPATPPIIAEPTDIDDDDLDWYYDEYAGGYVLSFGKHAGMKIHETSITYLYWCNRTLDRNRYGPTIRAIQVFHAGLKRYLATNYGEFKFPFGQYRGMKISECPDDYLSWANGQPHMISKYGIFFEAVTRWLECPLQEKGSFKASHLGYLSKDGGIDIVNARGLDERNNDLVESPSRSNSKSSALHVSFRIIQESKKASDADLQKDSGGGQRTSISEPKSKADTKSLEHNVGMSATVTLQEEHTETRDYATRHSATALKLQGSVPEESLPSSVTRQNERNLKESERAQRDFEEDDVSAK